MKKPTLCIVVLFVFVLSGCSSYLTSSENVSNLKNAYEKILVVGRSKDNTARVKFENSIVAQLKEQGIQAIASLNSSRILDITKTYSESELAALKKALLAKGFDGAIVTNLINTEAYTDVVAGGSSTTYVPTRVGRFGRYLAYYPITTWEPDQLKSGTKYIFESSLYRIEKGTGENLQWVGRFELKDPSSLKTATSNYAKDLTKALIKSSISNGSGN